MQCFTACWQAQPMLTFPPVTTGNFSTGSMKLCSQKDKVIVVMGATGTGKSRLAIDIATQFGGEIINSDKMQVYDGLDIVTNKVTYDECAGIPHHLLRGLPMDADFSARDFRRRATMAADSISARGWLPIIAGGSNSYIEELIEGDRRSFRNRFDCCFLWVDVALPVLHGFVSDRVDKMLERGLVEEVRRMFDPTSADYSRGIRRAIGMPEMDRYLRAEAAGAGEAMLAGLMEAAVEDIKANTCKLACCQLEKIRRLRGRWGIHRVDATGVFRERGRAADDAWAALVASPSMEIVEQFLHGSNVGEDGALSAAGTATAAALTGKLMPAVGATV